MSIRKHIKLKNRKNINQFLKLEIFRRFLMIFLLPAITNRSNLERQMRTIGRIGLPLKIFFTEKSDG